MNTSCTCVPFLHSSFALDAVEVVTFSKNLLLLQRAVARRAGVMVCSLGMPVSRLSTASNPSAWVLWVSTMRAALECPGITGSSSRSRCDAKRANAMLTILDACACFLID